MIRAPLYLVLVVLSGPERCGVYDHFGSADELSAWVAARGPARIGVNMAADIGGADVEWLYPVADRILVIK